MRANSAVTSPKSRPRAACAARRGRPRMRPMESPLAALSIAPEHAQVLGDIWGILDAHGPIFPGRRCAPEGLKGGRTPPILSQKTSCA